MPSIKKPADQGLDWSSFPPPTPEAEKWKPDPNSIARPSGLRDPRFGRDPYEEAKLRAARKTHGYHIHHSSEVSSSRSSSTSATPASRPPVGQWPAQAPRRVEPVVHPAVDATPSAPTEQPTSANSPPAKISTVPEMPAGLAVRPSYFAGTAGAKKQTMESFMPTPVQARSTMSSASPGKATLPAWAGPLEKALADGASMKSVPPHLRKPTSNEYPRAQQVIKLAPSDTNERDSSNLGARFEVAVEASRRVSDSSIVKEKGENGGLLPHTAKQECTSSNGTTGDSDEQPATTDATYRRWRDYGHFTKVSLVLAMEMKLREEELRQLSDRDLEKHIMQVSSLHQQLLVDTGVLNQD